MRAPQVQQHWVSYTEKMDLMVENALRFNVKKSLQELSKAINGDSKMMPSPLFKVQVVLQQESAGSLSQVPPEQQMPAFLGIHTRHWLC